MMTLQRKFNILYSSAGHHVDRIRGFQQSLAEMKIDGQVFAADMNPTMSPACMAAAQAFAVPRCTDAQFIPAMLEICKANQISLLMPTIDPELPIYVKHQEAFASIGTKVVISSPEAMAIGVDKKNTHRWLLENNIPTVRQCDACDFEEQQADWTFPLLVKPIKGSASIGVAIVENLEELKYHTQDDEYLVQSIASGQEYTVDVFINQQGESVCAVPRRRIEVRSGEVFKGITERVATVEKLVHQVGNLLPGGYGTINVQIFYDRETDQGQVIEINPRIAGGSHLSWQAGAKFTQWLIEDCLDMDSTANNTCWQDGLMMLRYMDAIFVPLHED